MSLFGSYDRELADAHGFDVTYLSGDFLARQVLVCRTCSCFVDNGTVHRERCPAPTPTASPNPAEPTNE